MILGFTYGIIYASLVKLGSSFTVALIGSAIVMVLPAYLIPPRPSISFLRYVTGHEILVAAIWITFWPIPKLLGQVMPLQLAYALPLLSLSLLLYFVLPIFYPDPRRIRFSRWALVCLLLSLAVACAVTLVAGDN